jgi:Lon protease-like protein
MTDMAMFPLGSVLFPYMPLQLRVFEERYLVMLAQILPDSPAEFGVVLIERGQEVGGGEKRFALGTVAQVTQLEVADGFIALLAEGDRRVEVTRWLDEEPFPRAVVREIDELEWDDTLDPLWAKAETTVRRSLALASEFTDQRWASTVELAEDPVAAAWQLAAIAPLEQLDQVALLRATTMEQLLSLLIELTEPVEEALRRGWPETDDEDEQ